MSNGTLTVVENLAPEDDSEALQRWAVDRGVAWLSVVSTHSSLADYLPPATAEDFNRRRDAAPTALLMDSAGTLGRAYGARTTPHMFIVAPAGTLAYLGAIDSKPTVDETEVPRSRNYVRAALEDIAAGRVVAMASIRPYGCTIGYGG